MRYYVQAAIYVILTVYSCAALVRLFMMIDEIYGVLTLFYDYLAVTTCFVVHLVATLLRVRDRSEK